MGNFFAGFILFLIGFSLVVKTNIIVDFFGYSEWAESKLGMFGGTRLMIKIIGLLAIFVGFFYMVGLQDVILGWIAGFLVPGYRG